MLRYDVHNQMIAKFQINEFYQDLPLDGAVYVFVSTNQVFFCANEE